VFHVTTSNCLSLKVLVIFIFTIKMFLIIWLYSVMTFRSVISALK